MTDSRIGLADKIALTESVLMEDLAGEAILLDLASEEYFALNEIGTRMLNVITESTSVGAALVILGTEYEVDTATLEQDILEYLEKLLQSSLVEIVQA